VEEARETIAHGQKIFVQAQLDTVEIAARGILQDAAQRDHIIGRRIEPRQALVSELRHSDQKGVPGHNSANQAGGADAPRRSAALTDS
jgi:hypothetical protein